MAIPHQVLRPARMAEIDAVVADLHRQVGVGGPPFPFREFLDRFHSYRVFEVDLPRGLDGRIRIGSAGEPKIVHLRRQNARPRVRFTLAHEILHAELHDREGTLADHMACRTSDRLLDGLRAQQELEADYGAAQLLMPLWALEDHVPAARVAQPGTFLLRRLARRFRVSESAMQTQLSYLACRRGEAPAHRAHTVL